MKIKEICAYCKKVPPRIGKKHCQSCAEKNSKYQSKWKQKVTKERKEKGLCSCGNPTLEGKKTCEQCNKRNLKNYYKRKKLNLCSYCGNKVANGLTRCEPCIKKHKEKNRQLREEVFNAYGGPICNCCGETIDKFLTLDHANNDGSKHRKEIGKTSVLRWLQKNNYPEGYQVLCFNCNCGRQLNNGICPHKL